MHARYSKHALILCALLLLAGCAKSESPETTASSPAASASESGAAPLESSAAESSSVIADTEGEGTESSVAQSSSIIADLAGEEPESSEKAQADAPVNLSDMEAVTKAYVDPLIWCGPLWSYTWKTPAQIKVDDLLAVFGYNNFLNLPQDFEGCFQPEDANQPAGKVEPFLVNNFGVTGEYLKTSQYYDAATDTYQMIGGFGGGWNAVAASAERQGDDIVIQVKIHAPVSDDEKTPDMEFAPDGRAILPGGVLTVRPAEAFPNYISFVKEA